ncbi:MAG TPA: DUF5041 domain-containing protein [Gelidibacter sp.]|uniref:DUF5041 domain-containing protein n=1 Tax=Gelidibacter sp. TaxID=2018083 RepID=UPI002C0335B6|nr:DUF5041 domain-containing protein [Gelidibacter sp.]HTO34616.1 DUF5041 domain-containing protein [Flavobacterium sp.]HXJ98584.1 DUF5041 domain-containing protein [Gelidibacter sp.]
MKKFFIIFCVLVLPLVSFGQEIKSKNVELDDLIVLLGASGYELFNFDVTQMLNKRYDIVFIKKEFLAGKEIESSNITMLPNKTLLTDFPESERQKLIDEGRVIDIKAQAIAHLKKFSFGFYPSSNDSIKTMQLNVPGFIVKNRIQFKMKGFSVKDLDKLFYSYHTRPFKINAFKEDEFIPLLLLGSSWHDKQFDVYRFCGEREIEPDMTSEILKDVPHHYILGVKFVKK